MSITWHGAHNNWDILHATKNDNFPRMENGTHIHLPVLFKLVSRKNTVHWKHFDHKVGISLILFHNTGKLALPIFSPQF